MQYTVGGRKMAGKMKSTAVSCSKSGTIDWSIVDQLTTTPTMEVWNNHQAAFTLQNNQHSNYQQSTATLAGEEHLDG